MPSRAELNIRAKVVGVVSANYPNDSKFEQRIIYEEKNAAAETGALATGTLTSDATNVTALDTVTIGAKTYKFVTALTEVKAAQTLTSDATNVDDGDTVTIDAVTYTFKTTLSTNPTKPFEVLIGTDAATSLDYLLMAINATGGTEGTEWSTGTTAHPSVTATTNANTTQIVEAKVPGTNGNKISVAETSAHLSWGAAKLASGVNPIANEVVIGSAAADTLDNLKTTINGTGQGTTCSTGTVASDEVTATTNSDTQQVVQAIQYGSGNTIASTEASTHLAWGATTLASGDPKVIAAAALDNSNFAGGARV